jgi:hypothetical protein
LLEVRQKFRKQYGSVVAPKGCFYPCATFKINS